MTFLNFCQGIHYLQDKSQRIKPPVTLVARYLDAGQTFFKHGDALLRAGRDEDHSRIRQKRSIGNLAAPLFSNCFLEDLFTIPSLYQSIYSLVRWKKKSIIRKLNIEVLCASESKKRDYFHLFICSSSSYWQDRKRRNHFSWPSINRIPCIKYIQFTIIISDGS